MKKDRKAMGVLLASVSLMLILCLPVVASAGQVVTDDLRQWAEKALKQEKSLEGLEAQNTVTVLYFISRSKDPLLVPLQKGLAIMLITDLRKLEKFDVVDRVRLQALLEEMKLSESGLVDEETRIKLGKLLKARWIVGGQLDMNEKRQLNILSQVLDSPRSKILGKPEVEGLFQELLKLEKKLLFDIVELLKVKLTPEQRKILEQPITLNMDALFAYFKGIDASDRGDYEKAADFYGEANKLDPEFELPKLALLELIDLKLIRIPSEKRKRKRGLARSLRGSTSLTDTLITEAPMKRLKKPGEAKAPEKVEEPGNAIIDDTDQGNNNNGANYGYPFVGSP